MAPQTNMRRTPLHACHRALGARLVEFAGWEMPVQYDGVLAEHERVRTSAGLFDVSHMGELFLSGRGALPTLDNLATNDVGKLVDGQALYTALCNEQGGVRDDALIYRFDATRFMLVVNAANADKILAWTRTHLEPGTDLVDRTADIALLAIQGPRSLDIAAACDLGGLERGVRGLAYYHFAASAPDSKPTWIVSRTGYTGELGLEVYCDAAVAVRLWEELLERGKKHGLGPAGLAARDTLRFEAAYCLYGHELAEDVSPLEAGIGWTVKLRKPRFIGKDALVAQKQAGLPRRLVGLEVQERAIPRQGCSVWSGDVEVGRVTSGTFAPTLKRSLALALVSSQAAGSFDIDIRGRRVAAQCVDIPFYASRSA